MFVCSPTILLYAKLDGVTELNQSWFGDQRDPVQVVTALFLKKWRTGTKARHESALTFPSGRVEISLILGVNENSINNMYQAHLKICFF